MSEWKDEARMAAAREYGARHYRWFAFANAMRGAGPALFVLVVLAAAGGGLLALDSRWRAPVAGGVVGVIVFVLLARAAVHAWRYRRF